MLLSKLKESHPRDTEAGDDESDEIIHDLANVRFEISLCYDGAPVSRNGPYWTSRENILELIELYSRNKVSVVISDQKIFLFI